MSLRLKTQGPTGGNPTWKDKIGYAATFIDEETNQIIVDAYQGQGLTYRRRDKCLIKINQYGAPIFSGNFDEFAEIIKLGLKQKEKNNKK